MFLKSIKIETLNLATAHPIVDRTFAIEQAVNDEFLKV